jgi:hypothetical protein
MAMANTIESKCEFIYVCDNIHLTLQPQCSYVKMP